MTTPIFPSLAGIAYPAIRTPIWSTLRQQTVSGKEQTVALWSYPRWKWQLDFYSSDGGFLRDDATNEFGQLLELFMLTQGGFGSFLYQDPDDHAVAGQGIAIGTGAAVTFPMVRSYKGYSEPVFAVNPSPLPTIRINGTVQTYGSAWNIAQWDGTWLTGGMASGLPAGSLHFASAPASGAVITADFSYYWPCRFTADSVDFQKFMNNLWEVQTLEFESVKL